VRMIQAGNRSSFALEPFSQFRTICKMGWQNRIAMGSNQLGIGRVYSL
jgi:hypothetical protein